MAEWFEKEKYSIWKNRIKDISKNYPLKLENDIDRLIAFVANDTGDENAYFRDAFEIIYRLFEAKVKYELQETNQDYLPFASFENKYEYLFTTLGMSPAPIILSISAIKPKKVIFIRTVGINEKESENIFDDYEDIRIIQTHLKNFCKLELIKNNTEVLFVDNFSDTKIKKAIDSKLNFLKGGKISFNKIAFDVTGGKKSIGNAAFTIAALRNIDCYYVDFEAYKNNNPVPGTEFIRLQQNPINEFIKNLGTAFNNLPIYKEHLTNNNLKELSEMLVSLGLLQEVTLNGIPQIQKPHFQDLK